MDQRPERQSVDIFISGGGIAGLMAAVAFGKSGFSVVMADPAPPVTDGTADGADLRSTAFLRPARDLFRHIGIWEALAPHATPLEALRIVDTTGQPPEVRGERLFEGAEMGDEPFGWNFMNWMIRREVLTIAQTLPNVDLRYGTGFKSVLQRLNHAIVTLTDGSQIDCKLAVAADGRTSPLREAAGIGVKTTRYGQKSLAFVATHEVPHHAVSTEIYREGGPFTMVPLPDVDGKPASAIVWMNKGPRAAELMSMDAQGFNAAMTDRSAHLFGQMELASAKGMFPIITQTADHLTAQRVAVIAEAAHVLPPIGAQGLNTSLNDLAALLEAAMANQTDPGAPQVLARYAKVRETDIAARARVIDLFNRITRSGEVPLQSLRLAGLKLVHDLRPLRRGVMRAGLGPIGKSA